MITIIHIHTYYIYIYIYCPLPPIGSVHPTDQLLVSTLLAPPSIPSKGFNPLPSWSAQLVLLASSAACIYCRDLSLHQATRFDSGTKGGWGWLVGGLWRVGVWEHGSLEVWEHECQAKIRRESCSVLYVLYVVCAPIGSSPTNK